MDYTSFLIYLHVFMGLNLSFHSCFDKCVSIILPDLDECKAHGIEHLPVSKCIRNDICNKTFHISTIQAEPISSHIVPFIFGNMLDFCCGKCTQKDYMVNFTDQRNVNLSAISSSHFVYPVLGYKNQEMLYNAYYIPLLEAPETALYTKEITGQEILDRLIKSCLGIWPIVIICLLLSIIAGFPVWLMETWTNRDEFPRPFLIGLFEGFWWSFITMTTVGYGDKAPKFIIAKLFAIVWILIGVTIIATFTAAITTEISSATTPTPPAIQGAKIGILKGRLYDASIVLKKGGHVEVTKEATVERGVYELVDRLRNGSIYGFLIDKFTYAIAYDMFTHLSKDESTDHKYHEGLASVGDFFLNHVMKEDIINTGETLSYGLLVKDKEDYDYFKQFAMDNHQTLLSCRELELHFHYEGKTTKTYNIFQPKGIAFETTVIIIVIILAVIFVVGISYEIVRILMRKNEQTKVESKRTVMEMRHI